MVPKRRLKRTVFFIIGAVVLVYLIFQIFINSLSTNYSRTLKLHGSHHNPFPQHFSDQQETPSKQVQSLESDFKTQMLTNLVGVAHKEMRAYSVAFNYEEDVVKQFVCLYSKETIHLDHFNDDFCDCKDGTDEPSTTACSHVKDQGVFAARFYCKLPCPPRYEIQQDIPYAFVNDG